MPSWILIGACDICNACRSVFATRNSTPSTLALIMRFTALPPPPPTPITLILALLRGSSLKWMRMSFSGGCIFFLSSLMSHSSTKFSTQRMEQAFRPASKIARSLGFSRGGFWAAGAEARNYLPFTAGLKPCSTPQLQTYLSGSQLREQRAQAIAEALHLRHFSCSGAVRVHGQPDQRGKFGFR